MKVYVATGQSTAVGISPIWLLLFAPFLVPILIVRLFFGVARALRA